MFDVAAYQASIKSIQAYREPTAQEAAQFIDVVKCILEQVEVDSAALQPLGYSIQRISDAKEYWLIAPHDQARAEQAWGVYLIDCNDPVRSAVAAPHPKSDINSEVIAFDLWRRTNGSMLMLAGAHRKASDKLADVTRHENSLFHHVSNLLATNNIAQVQMHAFANESASKYDVITGAGMAEPSQMLRNIAFRLEYLGLRVGTAWGGDLNHLLGYPNMQSRTAKQHRTPFLHIEMNRTVRNDFALWHKVTDTIARQLNRYNSRDISYVSNLAKY